MNIRNTIILKKINKQYFFFSIKLIFFILLTLNIIEFTNKFGKKKKIGVVGLKHHQNIGNNLLKYSIFILLKKYGFDPYIIGKYTGNSNITFLKNYVNVRIIKHFSEIKENDYDILMVNSDQTWRKWNKDFYNIAFLKFSNKWIIPKFIYGTSIGFSKWMFTKKDEYIAKYLLKKFTGISVRDKLLVQLIYNHLGFKSLLVLDPTLLINKKYYLQIIKNYKSYINENDSYIFIYKIIHKIKKKINLFAIKASKKLNYKIFKVDMNENEYIEKFLYGINHCKAVITDSFHGTIFAIIFNKPFIAFKKKNDERFKTLRYLLGINDRFVDSNKIPDLNLLNKPLSINKTKLNQLKLLSLKFLKKNLNISSYLY